MSSESSGLDDSSSSENIELKEFARSSEGYSDLGSNEDFTASCGLSSKMSETKEKEINDVAMTDLNISDENLHEFNIKLGSFSSLKGISPRDLTRNIESSGLNRKSSSMDKTLISRASSLEPLKESLSRTALSLDLVKGSSTRKFLSVDPLEGHSTKNVSSLDPFEPPSTRRISSLDTLEGSSLRKVSSINPLEGPSARTVWLFDSAKDSSTSNCKSQSLDPLEGPSTRKVCLSYPADGSLTSICQLPNSETETNEPSNNELPTDQNGCYFRILTWLNSFLRRYSRQIRHSKYYSLLHLVLFSIPISAGYMGAKYYTMCAGCPRLPFLVFMLGILGMCVLTVRLASILSNRYFTPDLTGREFDCWLVSLLLPFGLYLIVEMFTTYTCEPVFIPRVSTMEEFCYVVFYNYAYYLNVAVPLVILLLLLIYIPGLYDPAEAE